MKFDWQYRRLSCRDNRQTPKAHATSNGPQAPLNTNDSHADDQDRCHLITTVVSKPTTGIVQAHLLERVAAAYSTHVNDPSRENEFADRLELPIRLQPSLCMLSS